MENITTLSPKKEPKGNFFSRTADTPEGCRRLRSGSRERAAAGSDGMNARPGRNSVSRSLGERCPSRVSDTVALSTRVSWRYCAHKTTLEPRGTHISNTAAASHDAFEGASLRETTVTIGTGMNEVLPPSPHTHERHGEDTSSGKDEGSASPRPSHNPSASHASSDGFATRSAAEKASEASPLSDKAAREKSWRHP